MNIDMLNQSHRALNERLRKEIENGETDFELQNIMGQRYIATGFTAPINLTLHGVPGNDLGAFMAGPSILVKGNGQDGIGNTMSAGTIVIDGDARDLVGHSMRGGRIFVRGDVGFRSGVHMKSYEGQFPAIVIGGSAGDFTGEYMAGGVIVILNLLNPEKSPIGHLTATGIHGGAIYIRGGDIDESGLGREAGRLPLDEKDEKLVDELIAEWRRHFPDVEYDYKPEEFCKLVPLSHRPYGRLYAY